MKKTTILAGFSLLIFAIGLNFSSNNNVKIEKTDLPLFPEANLASLFSLDKASAECDDFWPWSPSCNERIESIVTSCAISVVTTTYYDVNGEVTGTTVTTGGLVEGSAGSNYVSSSSENSSQTFNATRVNCPTDGSDNDCEEYDPCK